MSFGRAGRYGRLIALAVAGLSGCAPSAVKRCEPVIGQLTYAKAARALQTGDIAACGGAWDLYMKRFHYPFEGDFSVAEECRRLASYMTWLKSVILKSPGTKELCLKTGYDAFAPADMGKACDIILTSPDDPAGAAKKLSALFRPGSRVPANRDAFPEDIAVSVGLADEKVCALRETEVCLATIRFRKAHEAKDASLCGASGLCLGMMGAADADGPYRAALAGHNCDIIP